VLDRVDATNHGGPLADQGGVLAFATAHLTTLLSSLHR
jgi:hypothetical protein